MRCNKPKKNARISTRHAPDWRSLASLPDPFRSILRREQTPFGEIRPVTDLYNIEVSVETTYVAEHSEPEEGRFVFAYTITLVNRGSVSAQLLSRHWVITDADSQVEEVRGDGVVGEQPVLKPGEGFRYTSGAVIETPVGTMHGSYQMVAADGQQFDATIPEFVLSAPRTLH